MDSRLSIHTDQSASLPAGIDSEQRDLIPLFLLRYDRPNTRRSYTRDLQSFFQSDAVTLEMARAASFADVNAYIEGLESEGYASATLRRRVASLRGFFAWLVALGVLNQNPADRHLVRRIKRSGGSDRAITVLTREQARHLIEAVDMSHEAGVRNRALIYTLLHCVLRRSEAAAMDFEHLRPVGRYWVLDLPSTKGGADQFVKVPDTVRDEIKNVSEFYGTGSGPVWRSLSPNSFGRRLSTTSIYDIVNRTAVAAGIEATVGAHTLRHTGCTLAIEAGATVQQVQSHARHKNLETTMIYVHQRDRLADSAADFIDLGSEGGND